MPRELPEVVSFVSPRRGDERVYRKAFGRRLAAARQAAGLTQHQLSALRYQARTTLAHVERGSRAVKAFDVLDYARLVRCDPGWLLTGEGDGPDEDG